MAADLYEVIENAVQDSDVAPESTETPDVDVTPTETVETAPEASGEPTEAVAETPQEPDATEATPKPVVSDDFEKRHGVPALGANGRENRIPYSRVKKITEKAISEAKKEWDTAPHPKHQELETKVKAYEERLGRVDQFEKVMVNDGEKFFEILSRIPMYAEFFQKVRQAFEFQASHQGQPQAQQTPVDPNADMPQPNQKLSDGSMVYDMDGLKALMSWQAKQVEDRVTKKYEDRYKPIESEWQAQQRINAAIPAVQAQITKARSWKKFTENENEIVKVLQSDRNISLEEAYQRVVWPKMESEWQTEKQKLTADRNKVREELLAEIKQAPRSTAAPQAGGKPTSQQSHGSGPRKLEDVIADEVSKLKNA